MNKAHFGHALTRGTWEEKRMVPFGVWLWGHLHFGPNCARKGHGGNQGLEVTGRLSLSNGMVKTA